MSALPAETGAAVTKVASTPFELDADAAYAAWRAAKLADAPTNANELMVAVADPADPSAAETAAIRALCRRHNMAFYRTRVQLTKAQVLAFAARLGLGDIERPLLTGEDGVTELEVAGMAEARRGIYIPYSNKPLSWHTDGYYNPAGNWVLGMLLHCVRPAASGGEAQFLDPDIAYIRLRDADPAFITALMHPQALTIPANEAEAQVVRDAEAGPVFALVGGHMVMRYTHRLRSAVWRDDAATAAARELLRALLEEGDPRLTLTLGRTRTMSQPILLSDIIIRNPQARSFQQLIEVIRLTADAAGKGMLEMDIKPDFPDTPRNWEFLVESAFTWGTR